MSLSLPCSGAGVSLEPNIGKTLMPARRVGGNEGGVETSAARCSEPNGGRCCDAAMDRTTGGLISTIAVFIRRARDTSPHAHHRTRGMHTQRSLTTITVTTLHYSSHAHPCPFTLSQHVHSDLVIDTTQPPHITMSDSLLCILHRDIQCEITI